MGDPKPILYIKTSEGWKIYTGYKKCEIKDNKVVIDDQVFIRNDDNLWEKVEPQPTTKIPKMP